jgi:hypothetical protein
LISPSKAEAFLAEQHDRSRRGVFAMSMFFVRALGTKP